MEYVIYILYSQKHERYYVGQTSNLAVRLKQHNEGDSGWTIKYRPWLVIYSESFPTRATAFKRERYLKSLKNIERLKQYIAGWRSSTLPGS